MKKVTFKNGKNSENLAVGLYWANIAGNKPKAELATLSKELDKQFSLLRKVKREDESDSYQVALSDEKDTSGLVSGAAAIASQLEEVIFIEKLNSEQAWIVAVSDSEIIIGSDKVFDGKNSKIELDEIGENFAEQPVVVISPDVIEEGWLSSDDCDESLTFIELMAKAGIEKPSKELNSLRVSGGQSNSRTLLLGIIAIGMIGTGAYQMGLIPGVNQKVVPVYQELPPPTKVVENIIPKKAEPSDAQILENAYLEEISWLRNDFNSNNPSATVKRLLAFDAISEKYVNGWSARTISYNAENPQFAEIKWSRDSGGTPLSLRSGIGNSANVEIMLDGSNAVTYHNIIDNYDRGYNDIDIVRFIRNTNYKYENLMHDLISMNYVWKMDHFEFAERPRKIEGLKKRGQENTRQLKSEAKLVSIGGLNRNDMSALIKVLDSAKTFKLNKISINLEQDFQWQIDGVIYEK